MSQQDCIMTVCYGGSAWLAEELRPVITELGLELITIHEWPNADIKWELSTWLSHLKQADIVICPANYKVQPAKSANRLTQALSLGKPTICSPLDAYLQVAKKHPGSFLIADTKEEWVEKLKLLRDNPELRATLGQKALIASQDYSIEAIGKKWVDVLFGGEPLILKPVDLIIVNYNNARYLKLCIDSIRKNTSFPYNLIVSDAGSNEETWSYLNSLKDISLVGSKDIRRNYSEACNAGIEISHSDYFAILNSDLIVSDKWLNNIMAKFQTRLDLGACGVFSNCDLGWLHFEPLKLKSGLSLVPGMKYEQVEPFLEELYSFMVETNIKNRGSFKEQEWVAGYATVYSRKVVDEIGLFDPAFKNGCEDLDFCRRLKKKNYKIGQSLDSFVYHFGGVSRGAYETENNEKYHKEDRVNHAYLGEKWEKKRVMLYSGPMWEKWDFRNLETTGIGGSEVWLTQLSREFSKLGYKVDVFADCAESGIRDGEIVWHNYAEYPEWVKYNWVDYSILSRTTDPLDFPLRSGKIYTQIHDVFYLSNRDKTYIDKIDKHCVLSDWHRDFVADYHKIPKDKIALMVNGIDFKRFDDIKVERQPYWFHWSSSWDRGLDNVLYLWPFIKEAFPEAELHVYYGCLNWEKACKLRNDQEGLRKIAELEGGMKQPGVFNHGRKGQKELAEEICKASILLYPSAFSESFFITGIEAQYVGVPVICNKYAGIISTLGDSAIMLGNGDPYWPYSKEGREQFLIEVFSLLRDKEKWQMWSDRGRENAKKYSWTNCAQKWQQLFKSLN